MSFCVLGIGALAVSFEEVDAAVWMVGYRNVKWNGRPNSEIPWGSCEILGRAERRSELGCYVICLNCMEDSRLDALITNVLAEEYEVWVHVCGDWDVM